MPTLRYTLYMTGGEDYTSFGTSFIFESGSAPGTKFSFTIDIRNDAVVEGEEVIVIIASILSSRGEFSQSGGNNSVGTITILDNEGEYYTCIY